MYSSTVSPSAAPSRICTFLPSVRPSVTARSSVVPSAPTSQTLPFCTEPCTAVTGSSSAPSALPLTIAISAPSPANAVTPAGIAQVIVPDVVLPVSVEPSVPVVPVSSTAPIRRPVQVNGAGPPLSVTWPSVGALISRYCWSGVSVPCTDSVPGVTFPIVSPTATTWSLRVVRLSTPAEPATTVVRVTFGLFSVIVCMPVSGSVVTVGSTGVSERISSTGVSAATTWPSAASSFDTSPAAVDRTARAGSAITAADTVTVLVTVPVLTWTSGSVICALGCNGSVAVAASSALPNASTARAAAMTAHRMMRIVGKMIRRVTPTGPPRGVCARGPVLRALRRG